MLARRERRPAALRPGRALLLILALLAGPACGARWTDEQAQIVASRQNGTAGATTENATSGRAGTAGDDLSSGVPTTQAGSGTDAGSSGGATGGPVSGGESGGGGGDGPQAAGALACAAPSDAPGVSDGTLKVASISSLSGPVPGLGESSVAAVRAYVAMRNASGGVCGRQVELVAADDGQDNGRYRSLISELDSQVLGVVGGIAGGDAGGQEIVAQKKTPIVSTPISLPFYDLPTVFGTNPPFENPDAPIEKYQWLVSQGITKVALAYPGVDQTRAEVEAKHRPQMIASGMKIVATVEFPLSTLNFDAPARQVANSGAQYMLFVSEVGANASMARSLANTKHSLEYQDYITGYDPRLIELAGPAVEDQAVAWIRIRPNEEAGDNEVQDQFLEWMGRAAPGQPKDVFAGDAWAASKAFFDALEALDGPITRDALLAGLSGLTSYDAGGFLGTINMGQDRSNGCYVGMIVDGGKFRRLYPDQGFSC